MDGIAPYSIQLINTLGQIITSNKFLIGSLALLYIGRKGIAELIKKIVCLDFSWGKAKGSLRTIPEISEKQENKTGNLLEAPKQEKDVSEDITETETKESKNWFMKMHMAFLSNQFEDAERIFEKHQETVLDAEERTKNKAIYLNLRYTWAADNSALKQLECLYDEASEEDLKSTIAIWLSYSYTHSKNFASAEKIWETLLASTNDPNKMVKYVDSLAECYRQHAKIDKARKLIHDYLIKIKTEKAVSTLYKCLANLENKAGDKFIGAIAFEKAIESLPDNSDLLFDAAYVQGNTKLSYLSYLNYDTILRLSPGHTTARNNIGVEASRLDMKGISVQHYQRSADEGNTLAISNIAYLYLDKGFFNEAQEILQSAIKEKNPHKNVATALSELNKMKSNEDILEDQVKTKGIQQREFIREFADSLFISDIMPSTFQGTWLLDDEDSVISEVSNDKFTAKWEKENLIGQYKYEYSFIGTINKGTIFGHYTVSSSSPFASPGGNKRDFIAYIDPQTTTIKIMFRDNQEPLFRALVRKQKAE